MHQLEPDLVDSFRRYNPVNIWYVYNWQTSHGDIWFTTGTLMHAFDGHLALHDDVVATGTLGGESTGHR